MRTLLKIVYIMLAVGLLVIGYSLLFQEGIVMIFGIAVGFTVITFTIFFGSVASQAISEHHLFYEVTMGPGRCFNIQMNELKIAKDRGFTHVRYLYDSGMKREVPIDIVLWDAEEDIDTVKVELV